MGVVTAAPQRRCGHSQVILRLNMISPLRLSVTSGQLRPFRDISESTFVIVIAEIRSPLAPAPLPPPHRRQTRLRWTSHTFTLQPTIRTHLHMCTYTPPSQPKRIPPTSLTQNGLAIPIQI